MNTLQVVVTDVRKPDQLLALACRCNLILNCVGPYRHSGEDVVAACVTAGTDYLDVSGEPGQSLLPGIASEHTLQSIVSHGICLITRGGQKHGCIGNFLHC